MRDELHDLGSSQLPGPSDILWVDQSAGIRGAYTRRDISMTRDPPSVEASQTGESTRLRLFAAVNYRPMTARCVKHEYYSHGDSAASPVTF